MKKIILAVIFYLASWSAYAMTLTEFVIIQALQIAAGKNIELHKDLGPFDSEQKGTFAYGWKKFERSGITYLQISNIKPEAAKIFNKQLLGDDAIKQFTPPTNGLPYAGYAPDAKYFIIVPYDFLNKVISESANSKQNSKDQNKNYLADI